MTKQRALKAAKAIVGQRAAVRITPMGARIGLHGEYVLAHWVSHKPGQKCARYRCDRCSTADVVDADFIERSVWHLAGGWQTAYAIGRIDLGMFFTVLAEADSFEACLEKLKPAQQGAA